MNYKRSLSLFPKTNGPELNKFLQYPFCAQTRKKGVIQQLSFVEQTEKEGEANKIIQPNRYVARVMYDGTAYKGWQIQSKGYTVQGEIQRVLQQRYQADVPVVGAGRTDAGVHARGQVMHFDLPNEENDLQKLEYVMNQMLRHDIRVYNISKPPPLENFQVERNFPFHAIINAKSKCYTYRFYVGKCMDPMERRYRAHIFYPLDIELLREALPFFLGKHDFRSFSNRIESKELEMGVQTGELDTHRTIYSINMIDEGNGNYKIDFFLDGALYKMVRNIMGALLASGTGKIRPEEIPLLFKARSREKINPVVKAAPACGLTLEKVNYNGYE